MRRSILLEQSNITFAVSSMTQRTDCRIADLRESKSMHHRHSRSCRCYGNTGNTLLRQRAAAAASGGNDFRKKPHNYYKDDNSF
jgi:hypothetical protein